MNKEEAKFLFGRVIEGKAKEIGEGRKFMQKLPHILTRTLGDISDPLELEAAELIRLVEDEDGLVRVAIADDSAERVVAIYRKFVVSAWNKREFDQVAKLCQVALVIDPDNTEISCFLGRAKWELDDSVGLRLVRAAAERDRKFLPFLERMSAEQKSKDKLSGRMARGIFDEFNAGRAKLSEWRNCNESVCGRLSQFFLISAFVLFYVALVIAVLIE